MPPLRRWPTASSLCRTAGCTTNAALRSGRDRATCGGEHVMSLSILERKLLREVALLKGQIATIALVVAGGIACFICLRGTCDSLEWSRAAYYDRYRFADIFATAERAPESIARRIEDLPGVGIVQTRISKEVTLPIEGMERPAYGRLLSLPAAGEPATNALQLVA